MNIYTRYDCDMCNYEGQEPCPQHSNAYETARHRYNEIPRRIHELSMNNPLIKRVIDEYTHGNIVTKEEALCQMIVHLAANWKEMEQSYINLAMMTTLPTQPR